MSGDGGDRRPLGFVGLGRMGAPMAARLADWPGGLWVHDVDGDAVAGARRAGATVAADAAEVGRRARVVSVMVRDDEQVRDVTRALLAGAGPGDTIVIHSTISPGTAVALAEEAAPRDVAVADAPVAGGTTGASSGELAIMVGAGEEVFARCRAPLERLGSLVVHAGPVGAGSRAKVARNLIQFVALAAVTEAQRLAQDAGLDLRQLGEVVRHSDAVTGGPGAIMHRDTAGPVAGDDDWRPILEHVRALGEKDLDLAIGLAERLGVDVPLARLARRRLGPGLGLGAAGDERPPDPDPDGAP